MSRICAACFLLFFFLNACANSTPTAAPTAPPTGTASPISPTTTPTAAPPQTLTVPHWLSFDYPAGWYRIAGRAPGFAGVASRDIGILPENRLSGDTALFYAFRGSYQSPDPLVAMQEERLARLSSDVELLEQPTALTLGDLPAAALRYRFTLEDGEPCIVRLTLVRATDGRYAELWAISREADAARYGPLFDEIAASVTLQDMLPAPAIPAPADPPAAYRPVPDPGGAFTISIPPDWRASEADFGLLVRPSAVPGAAQIILGPVPAPTAGGAADILATIEQQLLRELVYDAVRVSPIAAAEAAPAADSLARAYYSGTDQGQPRFIVLHTTVSGDQQLYALALLDVPDASPPALLPIAESILNTLAPTP